MERLTLSPRTDWLTKILDSWIYFILYRSWQTVFLTENNHHKPSLPPIPPALKLFQDICQPSKSSFLIILCMVYCSDLKVGGYLHGFRFPFGLRGFFTLYCLFGY